MGATVTRRQHDLDTWFRSQLKAEEQVARAATPSPWTPEPLIPDWVHAPSEGIFGRIVFRSGVPGNKADSEFVIRFDPKFVLDLIAELKAVLDLHYPDFDLDHRLVCVQCSDGPWTEDRELYPCRTLCRLARLFRDREGWREEWEL
jgi:hypothetical protein